MHILCITADDTLKVQYMVSLVPRPKFFVYVTQLKDGSAKNLGLVSTTGVLVRMRMHYLVMEE